MKTTLSILISAAGLLAGCANSTKSASARAGDGAGEAPPIERTTLKPGEMVEVAQSDGYQWTGVAVSKTGRIFVNFPRWNDPYLWAVAEVMPNGTLKPFPNATMQAWDQKLPPGDSFVCVQSVHVDDADRLWVLDSGNPRFEGVEPGGAKLMGFDLTPGDDEAPDMVVYFGPELAPLDAYLNDVRVDTKRSVAYITDSGLGAIVVVDFKNGVALRRLDNRRPTLASEMVPIVGGKELIFQRGPAAGKPARIHSDGIMLSDDGKYLAWQALSGKTLYRVPTEVLRDPKKSDREVEAAVESLGETVVTDGMEMDAAGNIYLSAIELDAIIVRRRGGVMAPLVKDARLAWPDSFAWGPDGALYVTTSQIHRTPMFSADGSMPKEPFRLFKVGPAEAK